MKRVVSILLLLTLFFNVFAYFLAFRIAIKNCNRHYHGRICNFSYGSTGDYIILNGVLSTDELAGLLFGNDEYIYQGRPFEFVDIAGTPDITAPLCSGEQGNEKWQTVFNHRLAQLDKKGIPLQQSTGRLIIPVFKVPVPEKLALQIFQQGRQYQPFFYFYSVQTSVLKTVFVPPKMS